MADEELPQSMTRAERNDIGLLIRKRERVMKQAVEQRAAEMLAEFERQAAAAYKAEDDPVWQEMKTAAEEAVKVAQEAIRARCADLGILPDFAPGIISHWYGRGSGAASARQAELRRAAKASIEAMKERARAEIERYSLDAQERVLLLGTTSEAARAFVEGLPKIEALMPTLVVDEVKAVVDRRHVKADGGGE